MATKWATDAEIAVAVARWPRDVSDDDHVHSIMRETGLAEQDARMALDLSRGDSDGDDVDVEDLSSETA